MVAVRTIRTLVRRLALLSLLVLIPTACAQVPRASQQQEQQAKLFEATPQAGALYIYRQGYHARFWEAQVRLAGSIATLLPAETFLRLETAPGPAELICFTAALPDYHPFSIAAGEVRYFELTVHSGLFSPYCLLQEVPADHAQPLIKAKRMVEPI